VAPAMLVAQQRSVVIRFDFKTLGSRFSSRFWHGLPLPADYPTVHARGRGLRDEGYLACRQSQPVNGNVNL
jgi:hypothetical protein